MLVKPRKGEKERKRKGGDDDSSNTVCLPVGCVHLCDTELAGVLIMIFAQLFLPDSSSKFLQEILLIIFDMWLKTKNTEAPVVGL